MPNGFDKNLVRLRIACAAYRRRFGSWPSVARIGAMEFRNIAHLLDSRDFELLASRLMVCSRATGGMSVEGTEGIVQYGSHDEVDPSDVDEARRWLGVEPSGQDHDGFFA